MNCLTIFDVVKGLVVFDQIVKAAEFQIFLNVVLSGLASFKVLSRTFAVVEAELLKDLNVEINPFEIFEIT